MKSWGLLLSNVEVAVVHCGLLGDGLSEVDSSRRGGAGELLRSSRLAQLPVSLESSARDPPRPTPRPHRRSCLGDVAPRASERIVAGTYGAYTARGSNFTRSALKLLKNQLPARQYAVVMRPLLAQITTNVVDVYASPCTSARRLW